MASDVAADFPATDPPETDADGPSGLGNRLFKVVAGLVIASSFAVWIYAYSGLARRDPPDLLTTPGLSDQAEQICRSALDDVEAMPDALDADDEIERAEQIRATTARFDEMVTTLRSLEAATDRDEAIVDLWLDDWEVLIGDRLDYADRIAVDPNAEFFITDTGVNERLDRRITRMATTNTMVSCGAPTDVG